MQHQAENAGDHDGHRDDPKSDFDGSPPVKAGMKEDENNTQQPQPDMPSQPELGTPDPPGRNLSSGREQSGKDHHPGPYQSVDQPRGTSAGRTTARTGVDGIGNAAQQQDQQAQQHPDTMGTIKDQETGSSTSPGTSAASKKNSLASTRIAASCGQE